VSGYATTTQTDRTTYEGTRETPTVTLIETKPLWDHMEREHWRGEFIPEAEKPTTRDGWIDAHERDHAVSSHRHSHPEP
jgi:hypothetical protein